MISRKLFTAFVLAGSLCVALPAGAQNGAPQKGMDPGALAQALKNCPAFQGQQAPNPQNCPAFQGKGKPPKGSPEAAIDKKMNRIVKALERNKRSADTLINAAREAGASPESVADMQRMSEAFRQVFMSTVSPEQIINSLLSQRGQPAPAPAAPEGMIVTGPDGSTWIITPAQPAPQPGQIAPPPPGPRPGQMTPPPPPPGPRQGQMTPPPPPPGPKAGKPAGIPPSQGKPSAIGRQMQPQAIPPAPPAPAQPQVTQPQPPQGLPPAGFRMPPAPQQQQPQGEAEVIIMEETVTPEYLPLWPTKDDLGKDGVLKYLEKRSTTMRSN